MSQTLSERFNLLSMAEKLIAANLAVFVLFILTDLLGFLFSFNLTEVISAWLVLPSDPLTLLTRPWTLFTYMFVHDGFYHILFNLLVFYWFGRFYQEVMGGRGLLYLYILGGLAGGLLYVLAYNLFPVFHEVVAYSNNRGASAAVMAIMIATATRMPYLSVRLFFVLEVKLWVVAVLFVLLDLSTIPVSNAGGHIAHLGGALYGYLFMRSYLNDRNWHAFLDSWKVPNPFKRRSKLKKVYSTKSDEEFNAYRKSEQEHLNKVLDKIAVSGYESLSKEEREFLFKIGKS